MRSLLFAVLRFHNTTHRWRSSIPLRLSFLSTAERRFPHSLWSSLGSRIAARALARHAAPPVSLLPIAFPMTGPTLYRRLLGYVRPYWWTFGIAVLAFRDPDNIQVELTAPLG